MRHSFLLALLFAAPAAAQVEVQTPAQELERRRQLEVEIEKAVREAGRRRSLEKGVTYEEVLKDPDNIELNYRYANAQVQKGNLRGAAATLERILMLQPELPRVRLFYAVVLFRLDNLDDAERELQRLKPQPMPDSLRRELEDYLRQIRAKRRKTHYNILVGAGFDFDENRNAAPSTHQRLLQDTYIDLDANSTRQNDTAPSWLVNAGATHELGFQAGHQVFASASYYQAEQTRIKTLNLQNYGGQAGGLAKLGWVDATMSYDFSHMRLAQATYLRSRGPRLRLERVLKGGWTIFGEVSHATLDYNRTTVVPTGEERTGDKLEGSGGFSFFLTRNNRVALSYAHSTTGAKQHYNAYVRESFNYNHTTVLGKGQFVLASLSMNLDYYEQPEFAVSTRTRRDRAFRARATYGLPLGNLFAPLQGLLWTASYEYYDSHSNLVNYRYSTNKLSTLMTYRWDF